MMKTICGLFVIAAVACAMPTEPDVKELGDSTELGFSHSGQYHWTNNRMCSSGNHVSGGGDKTLSQCATECKSNSNCIGFVYRDLSAETNKCRLKSPCVVAGAGVHRKWYAYKSRMPNMFTAHANKGCSTNAPGMAHTNDGLNTCARKCYQNSNCGGFVLMNSGHPKCKFKASSCTQGNQGTSTYYKKN